MSHNLEPRIKGLSHALPPQVILNREADDREWARLAKSDLRSERVRAARAILGFISTESKVSVIALVGETRTQHVVRLRQIAQYAIHVLTGLSSVVVGDIFCRDHSTVLHSFRRAPVLMKESEFLKGLYDKVWSRFNGQETERTNGTL